jgi:poly-gamma-glutamate synthesis protein (capsule biosynthesis protein)
MTRHITVTATGDSLITRRLPEYQDRPFRGMVELIQSADVAFTNMEMVLSDYEGTPVVESGGGNLSAHPDVALDLLKMGFNLTAFANNHTLNYGEHGCLTTLQVLADIGLPCAGAGRDLDEARAPAYLDLPEGRIGLVGCASSFAVGQRAGARGQGVSGRPGLNPQRFDTLYVVDQEHLEAIKRIAEQTGVEKQRQFGIWLGFRQPPKREGEVVFADRSFIAGDEFGIRTELNENDLEGNARSVREAASRSELTIASIHAHEQGGERWLPADFIPVFAHAMIDAGADMVVGHGPHLLRGIELYQGKPIFYSVGNFIFQPELLQRLPPDDYDAVKADHALTPGQVFDQMFQSGERGFPADHRYWETVLPLCVFEDRQLTELTLHPLTLGFGQGVTQRGIPRLADRQLADEILRWTAELSEPFGTHIELRDGVGHVRV